MAGASVGGGSGGGNAAAIEVGEAFASLSLRDEDFAAALAAAEKKLRTFAAANREIRVALSVNAGGDLIQHAAAAGREYADAFDQGMGERRDRGGRLLSGLADGIAVAAAVAAGKKVGEAFYGRGLIPTGEAARPAAAGDLSPLEGAGESKGRIQKALEGAASVGGKVESVGTGLTTTASGFDKLSKAADQAAEKIGGKTGKALTVVSGALSGMSAKIAPAGEFLTNLGAGTRETAEGLGQLRESIASLLGAGKGLAAIPVKIALAPVKLAAGAVKTAVTVPAKIALAPVQAAAGVGRAMFGPITAGASGAAGAVTAKFRAAFGALSGLASNNPVARAMKSVEIAAKSAGEKVRGVGLGMAAAGTAGYFALDKMQDAAQDRGNALSLLAQKTGSSVEELSRLGFAAEKNGVSFETMADVVSGLGGRLSEVADSGDDTFLRLGLGMSEAQQMLQNPAGALDILADKLKGITNASDRSAVAERLGLGPLLPLLDKGAAGLKALKGEADEFGAVVSKDDTDKARAATVLWNTALTALKSAVVQIGTAMLPTVEETKEYMGYLKLAAGAVKDFIAKNGDVANKLQYVAAGVGAAGVALVALGTAGTVAGVAVGGIVTTVTAAAVVVGALLSPLGIMTAALVGGGYAFLTMTDYGKDFTDWLSETFGAEWEDAVGTAKQAWEGIVNALKAGDLEAAGEVAMAGLNLAWVKVVGKMTEAWNTFKANFMRGWAVIKKEAGDKFGDAQTGIAGFFVTAGEALKVLSKEDAEGMRAALGDMTKNEKSNRASELRTALTDIDKGQQDAAAKNQIAADEALAAAKQRFAEATAAAKEAFDKKERADREKAEKEGRKLPSNPADDFAAAAKGVRSATLANGSTATFAQALGMGDSLAKRSLTASVDTAKNTEKAVEKLGKIEEGIGKIAQQSGPKFSS